MEVWNENSVHRLYNIYLYVKMWYYIMLRFNGDKFITQQNIIKGVKIMTGKDKKNISEDASTMRVADRYRIKPDTEDKKRTPKK